jgi:hypothetical protein
MSDEQERTPESEQTEAPPLAMPSPSNPDPVGTGKSNPANAKPKTHALPPGARDVTEKFANILPGAAAQVKASSAAGAAAPSAMVNLNAMVSAIDAMKGGVNNTYLGNFTEQDAKGNVSRTVQVTGWQDIMMNEIVQDSRFGYSGTKAQFIRHAIELLITYYQESGMIAEERQGMFGDMLRAARMMREDAERERIRTDFTENIKAHDRSMETARMTGDWGHIAGRLERYMNAIESCENEAQRRILRGVFAESVATRTAVTAFNRWLNDSSALPKEHFPGWKEVWGDIGEAWNDWYTDWGSV